MECRKCPYYESRKEITSTGNVVVGLCKLRGKHMSDATIRREFCKDKAVIDVPQGAKTARIEPAKGIFTPEEQRQLSQARAAKAAERSGGSLTLQQMAEKKAADLAMKRYEEQQRQVLSKPGATPQEKPMQAQQRPKPPERPGQKDEKLDETFLRRIVWGGGK